jgi:hypothetical protein
MEILVANGRVACIVCLNGERSCIPVRGKDPPFITVRINGDPLKLILLDPTFQ